MARSRRALLALALAATALTLGACGDDGDSDEDEISEAIETSAATNDTSACTELQTQNFVEQTSGATGEAAVKQCQEGQDEPVADSVDITETEIDGDSATAVVAFNGGFLDGQSLDIGLVQEDDQWKLDELKGFAEFDRAVFVDTLVQGIREEAGPQAVACVRRALEGVSDEDLQATFLENDDSLFEQTLAPCFEGEAG
jgi:hypothetical protein